jgi:hypothetical protein
MEGSKMTSFTAAVFKGEDLMSVFSGNMPATDEERRERYRERFANWVRRTILRRTKNSSLTIEFADGVKFDAGDTLTIQMRFGD